MQEVSGLQQGTRMWCLGNLPSLSKGLGQQVRVAPDPSGDRSAYCLTSAYPSISSFASDAFNILLFAMQAYQHHNCGKMSRAEGSQDATQAMLQMKKLDLNELKRAYEAAAN